ncbi:unnamed protein product [Rotaria sp. Silwood1]|nr:unnamed protein product [Rotaria sp. Silwood1]CAF0866172.1 unnamed protein product [Rotaria sp. Silwood1]CAF3380772.1 unnamed protein product [Rotaria sp. Silwood1]CAF4844149.1 unnamed protein product [Rotaria sp. Silwood1]
MFELQSDDDDWTRVIHHDLNIKRRTCTTFIPQLSATSDSSRSRDNVQCGCNRLRREHSWDVFDGNDPEWNKKQHTTSAYNNAYGYKPDTHAHYIRCDIETQPSVLVKLMFDVWRVNTPRLIMCIIGGAKYFKLNERLEREFMKGIIKAALGADGWIVTTGFKAGVVQLVGEAIHDHKVTNPRSHITAIGFSKWGATKNRTSLITTKIATNSNQNTTINTSKRRKGEQELEPNHTHFLLLDDGTYYGYDIGDYRTKFVLEASRYKEDAPVVTIVVEGGPDTLSTIYKDLSYRIPVVLVNGSGRVPNLLANFLNRTESMIHRSGKDNDGANWKQVIDIKTEDDIEKLKTKFRPYADEIRDGLRELSKGSKTSDKQIDELHKYFLYCLQPAVRSKIRIFSLDSNESLDNTIFEAIVEAKQQEGSQQNKAVNREQLLSLALAWNAIHVAKEYIIKDDLTDLRPETKEKLFFDALTNNSPQFIDTFIKLNFDLSEMFYERKTNQPWKLKWAQLLRLYKKDEKKNKERLYLLHRCCDNTPIKNELDLDVILKALIGDYFKSIYTRSVTSFWERVKIWCRCSVGTRVEDSRAASYRDYNGDDSEVPDPEEAQKEARELVFRDLFLWSILTNRIEMSKVILSHMQTRICAALIASKIFKSYEYFAYDNESKDVLHHQADYFEAYANECLKCCYNANEEMAGEIAIRRINIFGNVSCLQVAVAADDKHFVAQTCCDQVLNSIWYDKIEPGQFTLLQRLGLLLSVCTFGLLAPFIVPFREEKLVPIDFVNDQKKKNYAMTVNETEQEIKPLLPKTKERLNNHGINYSDIYARPSSYCSQACFNYFRRLKQFHESPFIKFSYNAASYLFFLLLFSYYLLFDFKSPTNETPSIHWTEIVVIIIVTTMLFEDIRQFLSQESRSIMGKLSNYFVKNLFSSLIRIASYILFYIGLILRFTHASTDDELSVAKIILAYDLEIWYIRSLAFLGVIRNMGPKLVMIRRMLIDLFFFTYIILIAMVAYGVTSRSMYNYNTDNNADDLIFEGRSVFRHIIYPAYYLMYGSTDNELSALDQNPDLGTSIATQVLLAFHMLFVNILLINLLIAMFSYTFQTVQDQTDLVWRYERYSLIREYFDRPPLFPPFIIITHLIELIKFLIRHCQNRNNPSLRKKQTKIFKMIGANRKIDKEWSEFESYATNLYARTIVTGQPSSAATLVPSAARQEVSPITLDTMNASQSLSNIDLKTITDEMASIKRVIGDLRTYAEEMNRCMQWMMDAMERVKMSKEPKPKLRSAVTTNGEII